MLSFIRVTVIMVSLHSNRADTRGQGVVVTNLTTLLVGRVELGDSGLGKWLNSLRQV